MNGIDFIAIIIRTQIQSIVLRPISIYRPRVEETNSPFLFLTGKWWQGHNSLFMSVRTQSRFPGTSPLLISKPIPALFFSFINLSHRIDFFIVYFKIGINELNTKNNATSILFCSLEIEKYSGCFHVVYASDKKFILEICHSHS